MAQGILTWEREGQLLDAAILDSFKQVEDALEIVTYLWGRLSGYHPEPVSCCEKVEVGPAPK